LLGRLAAASLGGVVTLDGARGSNYAHEGYVAALANSSLSGILWTPEIRSAKSAEEWVRRFQTVCFSPMMQLNAWASSMKPWSFPEVTDLVRDVIQLRTNLLPYIYTAFYEYNQKGIPPFRAMVLESGYNSKEILSGGEQDDAENPYAEQKRIEITDQYGNRTSDTDDVTVAPSAGSFASGTTTKAAAAGLGFLYNNYLLDCHTTDPYHPHYLAPGRRPPTFVVPLFVMRSGRPWLIAGSPGSERILSTVTQFLIHIIDSDLPICESMRKPRLHYSPEGILSIEAGRYHPEIIAHLEDNAGELSIREDYSYYLGAIHATLRCRSKDEFQGAADVRRDGIALGD